MGELARRELLCLTLAFIVQILTNVRLLSLSVTSMQLAPIPTEPTSVLARMDFLVTEKLAKVEKVVSQINFYCEQVYLNLKISYK